MEPLPKIGFSGKHASCLPDSIPFLGEMSRKDREGARGSGEGKEESSCYRHIGSQVARSPKLNIYPYKYFKN